MKKLLLMLGIALVFASCSKDEKEENEESNVMSVTVQTAGTLENTLKVTYADVRDIKIIGPLNEKDCTFIASKMTSLVRLDLSKATFVNDILPDYAFYVVVEGVKYSTFSEIILPETLNVVGEYAFDKCAALKKVVFPVGLKGIGTSAFANCTSLNNVVLPLGVTAIRKTAFFNCISLVDITLPESLESFDVGSFHACTKLLTISIPSKIAVIPNDLFKDCTALKVVTLPANLSRIGVSAFNNTSLQSITLPEKLTDINGLAFALCASLTEVICKATVVPFLGSGVFNETPASKTLKVPVANVSAYTNNSSWKENFSSIVALSY